MSPPILRLLMCFLVIGGLATCAQRAQVASPEDQFAELESRLLETQPLTLRYQVTASGAFQASITGELQFSEDHAVTLDGEGLFGDAPVQLILSADQDRMQGGNGEARFDTSTPANLQPALVIGLTRMGILHNLARLTAAQAPDQADGNVRDWVKVNDLAVSGDTLSFAIEVAGQPSGTATLTLGNDGMPLHRTQEVIFPGGSMQVTEHYQWLP